jgi:glycosyltransferase involved in cell wall biosynthesis
MTTKLIIGPFKDMSGYATLAREYVKALFLVEDDSEYSLASVRYDSGRNAPMEPELIVPHGRPISSDIETVIQIVTPNEMRPIPGKRNIAVCCWETDRIPVYWAITLNSFDEIIVPCDANKRAFKRSGVTQPIHVIGMPIFPDRYSLDGVEPFMIPEVNEETTVFYNISQWSHKKGIDAAIRSYFLAFQNNENVMLVLKGYVGMHNQAGDAQKLVQAIDDIKASMRLQRYPPIYVTDMVMSDEQVNQLHAAGDCYVSLSRGEGWGIPPFEALLLGNELITTIHTGMKEWALPALVRPVASVQDSVHNMPHPDPQLYTANENWYEPIILSGADAFRAAFEKTHKNTADKRAELLEKLDPKVIGEQLKDIIEA